MIRHQLKNLNVDTPVELTIEDNINSVCTLVVENINDSGNIFIGNNSVSSNDFGFKLYPRQAFTVELRPYDRLYAVADSDIQISCMSIERSV